MTAPHADAAPRGLIDRMLAGYRDAGASMRALLAERPSDGVLLSLLIVAAFIGLLGETMGLFATEAAAPLAERGPDAAERFREKIGTAFVARMLFFPLVVYIAAAILTLIARAAGGEGGGYESRAAMIWALLLAAPLGLAVSAVEAAGAGETSALWIGARSVVALGLGTFALYIWSACVAEAHGFRSRLAVIGAALGVLAAAAGIWIALSAA